MAAAAGDPDEDDEALRWAGDEERGLAAPRRPRRDRATASESRASESPGLESTHDDAPADDDEPATGDDEADPADRARRTIAVVFALPFLAEMAGWVLATARLSSGTTVLWTEVLWQFGEFLAIVSPALWFFAALTLTRESRPLVRAGWLALGLGALLPWPALLALGGGAA